MKYFALLLLILFLTACKNQNTEATTESTMAVDTSNFPLKQIQKERVALSQVLINEFVQQKGELRSHERFELINNSDLKINHFDIEEYFVIKYSDTETKIYPEKFSGHLTEENYLDANGILPFDGIASAPPKIEYPWLPNETRTFEFYAPCVLHCIDLPKITFYRTPLEVTVRFKCKAMSVDGEFDAYVGYSVIDEWKDFQKELGLR